MKPLISQRLRAARKAKKLTQEQLANLLQTTKGTISNYENGHSTPSNEVLVLLSKKLDVMTDYLLGITDIPNVPSLSQAEKDEAEFQAFINDPELEMWYRELPKSKEEELRKLRTIWEMIKNEQK